MKVIRSASQPFFSQVFDGERYVTVRSDLGGHFECSVCRPLRRHGEIGTMVAADFAEMMAMPECEHIIAVKTLPAGIPRPMPWHDRPVGSPRVPAPNRSPRVARVTRLRPAYNGPIIPVPPIRQDH